MCHTSHDQNKDFDNCYYDSIYLNEVKLHLGQDWNTISNS
jgi:hypothetical protein